MRGMTPSKITLGRIGDAFGIKGWVHVFSFTNPAENIFHHKMWQIRAYRKHDAPWRTVAIEFHQPHGHAFIAKLKGCDDRDQALLLKNHTIAVERASLPALKENQYYWDDLVGLTVINMHGESFGVVHHLLEASVNTIMAVEGKTTHYILYTHAVVKQVDVENKKIYVEWESLT